MIASKVKALVIECRSDYALDYELMLNGFGYDVLFAPTAPAAGRALLEHPEIALAFIDADSVDVEPCIDVTVSVKAIPLLVFASPGVSVSKPLFCDLHLCRKPVVSRDVERIIANIF